MTGGGNFNQYGGSFSAEVDLVAGNYLLAGGNFSTAGLVIPDKTPPGPPPLAQASSFTQTDGTNSCSSLELFGAMPTSYYYGANGSYYLSNGTLLVAGTEAIDLACTFNQSGGIQTNAGISMTGAPSNHGPVPSYFNLTGGQILTPSVSVQSSTFTQSGGINQVSGTVLVTGGGFSYTPSGFYNLSGGLLSDSNATVYYAFQGGFVQGGGTHVVAQRLTVSGQPYEADGYVLTGGTLSAPVIQIDSGNSFRHSGGSVSNSDMLILSAGAWNDQTTGQQFGSLQLGANDSYSGTSSVLLLPPGTNCVLQFADSSSMTWSNQHTLNIQNWNGSLNGGGRHRVVFGNSSHTLTAQQLSQTFFINPGGVNGVFPSRILSTGEIIPGRLLLARPGAGNLVLQWPGGTTLQSATNLSGPWQDLGSFTSPYTNELGQPAQFFRLRQ